MQYEYDIFVSYKRYGEWTSWVSGEFYKVLNDHLSMELGRPAKIFIDNQIEAGSDWPGVLAMKLATSRVLVPLFSKMYFASDWCLKELYAARFKEDQLGMRTPQNPEGIIVAAKIHDGTKDDLPIHLHDCCRMQTFDLTEYAITSLKRTSPMFETFEEKVKLWVQQSIMPAIDRTRKNSPRDSWVQEIFNKKFVCPLPANYDNPDFPSLA